MKDTGPMMIPCITIDSKLMFAINSTWCLHLMPAALHRQRFHSILIGSFCPDVALLNICIMGSPSLIVPVFSSLIVRCFMGCQDGVSG